MTTIKPFQLMVDVFKKIELLGYKRPEHLTFGGFRPWFNETFNCELENGPHNAVAKAMLDVLGAQKPAKKGKAK